MMSDDLAVACDRIAERLEADLDDFDGHVREAAWFLVKHYRAKAHNIRAVRAIRKPLTIVGG